MLKPEKFDVKTVAPSGIKAFGERLKHFIEDMMNLVFLFT